MDGGRERQIQVGRGKDTVVHLALKSTHLGPVAKEAADLWPRVASAAGSIL